MWRFGHTEVVLCMEVGQELDVGLVKCLCAT
jgi:hypothetical protein